LTPCKKQKQIINLQSIYLFIYLLAGLRFAGRDPEGASAEVTNEQQRGDQNQKSKE
jgi:hypothetical protein